MTTIELMDWAVDCPQCGNIALAHLRSPHLLAEIAKGHCAENPGHHAIIRVT